MPTAQEMFNAKKRKLSREPKTNLQGLTKEDLGLLLHGLQSVVVIDLIDQQKKLVKKIKAELSRYGVSDVVATNRTNEHA